MSYHGPRPGDLPQAVTSHRSSMADSTEDTSPPTESTTEHTTVSDAPSDSALPNATSRRLYFYQGSAASLPVTENLSATMEQSIKDSLQVLSLNQVRSHIQHILAEFQPFDSEPPVPLSTRLTTAVNNIRDLIQDI